MIRTRYLAAALAALAVFSSVVSDAKVKTVSRDGEATVYLDKDFSKPFDLVYAVSVRPAAANTSFTMAGIMLLGRVGPATIYVGAYADPKGDVTAFTQTTDPTGKSTFQARGACVPSCAIELRGDATTIRAFVDEHPVGDWRRSAFHLVRPYAQLNGEATAIGDSVNASMAQLRGTIGGKPMPVPTCAFTTQGVEATVDTGVVWFTGTRRPGARVTYVSLVNGREMDKCP